MHSNAVSLQQEDIVDQGKSQSSRMAAMEQFLSTEKEYLVALKQARQVNMSREKKQEIEHAMKT
jgi:hypothetical protein